MAGLTNTVANATLNMLFGAGSNTVAPATYYVGLSLTAPQNDGSGVTEPAGGAYARVAVTNDATSWPGAANRVKSNGTVIVFPTAVADWGTVSHWVLYDAATGGVLRVWGTLTTPQAINSGGVPDFPVSSITINIG